MKELRCNNCNSNDLSYVGGVWVCNHCGSKFVPHKDEKPHGDEEDKLEKKMIRLFEKRDKYNGFSEKEIDKYLDYTDRIKDCISELLDINDKNPYAYTGQFLLHIADTFDTCSNAESVLKDAHKALDYADAEEINNIADSIRPHFMFHGKRIKEYKELEEEYEEVRKILIG